MVGCKRKAEESKITSKALNLTELKYRIAFTLIRKAWLCMAWRRSTTNWELILSYPEFEYESGGKRKD